MAKQPEKVVNGIRDKFDKAMAERDMRDAWRHGPIKDNTDEKKLTHRGFKLLGHAQLFLLIPRVSFIESSNTFDEFSGANIFSCSFIVMLQYIMFVLHMCAAQLDSINTPPSAYAVRVYLVPLPDAEGRTVDYLLVVDIDDKTRDVIDISKMFLELARSKSKQIDMKGKLLDETNARKRPAPAKPGHPEADPESSAKDKYGMFRSIIKNGRDYEKVMCIIAQKTPSQTVVQMDPINNLTLEAALRWAGDARIHPVHKVAPHYCLLETYRDGNEIILPTELLKFELSPDYWSPMLFCKQFMPHRIPENYNTIFQNNMQALFKETMMSLKKTPASTPAQKTTTLTTDTSIILYEGAGADELPQFQQEYTGPTRDTTNTRHTPTLADGADAAGGFNMAEDDNDEPTNPELRRIKMRLARNREIIREVHKAGFLTPEELLAWQTDATRDAIAAYVRRRKDISHTAREIYEYLEDHGLMEQTPDVNIIDTNKSGYDNFMAWFIEVLSVYCGVAVHQLTVWCLFILIGTAYDPPGQQMHACIMGDGGSGKSFSINALFTLLNKIGIITNDTNSRGANFIDKREYDAVIYHDEMDPTSLLDNGNGQVAEQKALLSNGFLTRKALRFDEGGGRQLDSLMCVQACPSIGSMNKDHTSVINADPNEKTNMAALMSRYVPFDMSSYKHFQRTVQFTKAGMNNPDIEKSMREVINKIIVLQRWRMEVGHLLYIGALPPVRMNALSVCLTKFEKTLSDVNIKATNNRQSVNVERFCRQTTILRCIIERFCLKGVSPYYGKDYRTEYLIGIPLVATLDDVTHACTSLYHTYVPKTLTNVISLLREEVISTMKIGDKSTVIFCNPTNTPIRGTGRKAKKRKTGEGEGGGGDDDDDEEEGGVKTMQYVGFRDLTIDTLANRLHTSASLNNEVPAELSIRSCLWILHSMLIATPIYTWEQGMEIPVQDSENDMIVHKPGIQRKGRHTFVNLKLLDNGDSRFEDLWRQAVLSMCDAKTPIRSVLTGMAHRTHVWIPQEIVLAPQTNTFSVVLNPTYLSPNTRLILTGSKYGSIGGDKGTRLLNEDTNDGITNNNNNNNNNNNIDRSSTLFMDESSRAFINYDMSIDFSNHHTWFVENGMGAVSALKAIEFAKENEAATKIALMRGVIIAQLESGEIPADREFISFPSDAIEAMDALQDMNTALAGGKVTSQDIAAHEDIIINVSDVMKGGLDAEGKAKFDSEMMQVEIENQEVHGSAEGIGAAQYATMFGMEMQEGESLQELIKRRFIIRQQTLHPTMGTKRIDMAEEEEEEVPYQQQPRYHQEPAGEEEEEGRGEEGRDGEGGEEEERRERGDEWRGEEEERGRGEEDREGRQRRGGRGGHARVSRPCFVVEPDEDDGGPQRKKRKTGKKISIVDVTNETDE